MSREIIIDIDQPDGNTLRVYATRLSPAVNDGSPDPERTFTISTPHRQECRMTFAENFEAFTFDGHFTAQELGVIAAHIRRAYDDGHREANPVEINGSFKFYIQNGCHSHLVQLIPQRTAYKVLIDDHPAGILRTGEALSWELSGAGIEDYELLQLIIDELKKRLS